MYFHDFVCIRLYVCGCVFACELVSVEDVIQKCGKKAKNIVKPRVQTHTEKRNGAGIVKFMKGIIECILIECKKE